MPYSLAHMIHQAAKEGGTFVSVVHGEMPFIRVCSPGATTRVGCLKYNNKLTFKLLFLHQTKASVKKVTSEYILQYLPATWGWTVGRGPFLLFNRVCRLLYNEERACREFIRERISYLMGMKEYFSFNY